MHDKSESTKTAPKQNWRQRVQKAPHKTNKQIEKIGSNTSRALFDFDRSQLMFAGFIHYRTDFRFSWSLSNKIHEPFPFFCLCGTKSFYEL
jgi:hypothetical protein